MPRTRKGQAEGQRRNGYPYRDTDNRPVPNLAEAIRGRIRTLREALGWTQEELALRARMFGLDWDHVTVKNIEAGTRDLTIAEWFLVLMIFDASVAEFFGDISDRLILLSSAVARPPQSLADMVSGRPTISWALSDADAERWRRDEEMNAERRLAEQKAARALGVDVLKLKKAAQRLWARPLTHEREAQLALMTKGADVDPRTRQALRGHITRRLLKELREAGVGPPVPKKRKRRKPR